MTTSVEGSGDWQGSVQNAGEAMGIGNIPETETDTKIDGKQSDQTTTSTTQKKSDDGGCMKIFQMILQIATAVIAVVQPQFAPILAAVSKGLSSLMGDGSSGSSGSSSGKPVDVSQYQAAGQDAVNWGNENYNDYLNTPEGQAAVKQILQLYGNGATTAPATA